MDTSGRAPAGLVGDEYLVFNRATVWSILKAVNRFRRVAVTLVAMSVIGACASNETPLAAVHASSSAGTATEQALPPMEGWYSYDYQAGVIGDTAENVFFRTVKKEDGSVWADSTRWSIDTPESPESVLALIRYERWDFADGVVETSGAGARDLRGQCATFELRGDKLALHGGIADFWVMSSTYGVRWHTTVPLTVTDNEWSRNVVRFDGSDWRRSWSRNGRGVALDSVLANANSYGIGFVKFDGEPSGAIGLRGFGFSECGD
jgi:hypothetical protein